METKLKSKFYVINLLKDKDRRESTAQMLEALGVEYEFFVGVDGKQLTDSESSLCLDSSSVTLSCKTGGVRIDTALTPAEKGCSLSNLRVHQKIIDDGLDYGIIMEDDVLINEDTIHAINNINCITESWDVISFSNWQDGFKNNPLGKKYYFNKSKGQYFKRAGFGNEFLDSIFNRKRILAQCTLYIVSVNACRKLVNIGYPVRLSADYLLGSIAYNNLKTFRAYPIDRFIKLRDIPSTIGYDRDEHKLYRV